MGRAPVPVHRFGFRLSARLHPANATKVKNKIEAV
jgi:hypothetical protein